MPLYVTRINAEGSNGNIFVIVGHASRLLRELGHKPEEIDNFQKRISETKSYKAACNIVEEFFVLDFDGGKQ